MTLQTREPGPKEVHNPALAAEESDVSPRVPLWIGVGSAVTGIFFIVMLAAIYGHRASDPSPAPTEAPPAPRLQADDKQDMLALNQREAAVLGTYGWGDAAHSFARIPIAEAMRQVAAHGIADWPPPNRPVEPGPAGFKVPQGIAIPGMPAPSTTPRDTPIPGLPQSAAPQRTSPAAAEPGDKL